MQVVWSRQKVVPSIVLTPGNEPAMLTGSMRSVPGVDAKALLDAVNARLPGALSRYGGHTGACGLTVSKDALPGFSRQLQEIYRTTYPDIGPKPRFLIDGELLPEQLSVLWIEQMEALGHSDGDLTNLFLSEFFKLPRHVPSGKRKRT